MKKETLVTELCPEEFRTLMEGTVRKVMGELAQPNKSRIESQLISEEELEKLMGVSKATLYLWRRDGKLPYQRIGKKIFYKISEVEKAMRLKGGKEQPEVKSNQKKNLCP